MDISKWVTNGLFDLAELLETLTKGLIVGMPRKAAEVHGISLILFLVGSKKLGFGISPPNLSSGEEKVKTNILDEELGHFGSTGFRR